MDSTNTQDDVDVTVQIDDPPSKLVLVNLNVKCKLLKVRERLEQNSKVRMNDTLSFANKINNNSSINGSLLAVIASEDEEKVTLKKIIDKKNKFVYLKSESEPDWKFLKDKFKLEYGRSETLEKANKRAFTIVDCEMNEIVDGYENISTIKINSEEAKTIKNDFLLTADIDMSNFAKFGMSIGNSNVINSNIVNNLDYSVIEYNKMSLKFKLEPTMEFNEAVNDIIDSKDPRKFKDIINEFGQFIPKEIILDGRELMLLQKKVLKKMLANILQIFKLFGGKQFGPNNFNEEDWIESLNDFKYWNCIKFKGLINIFQALSEELRKKVLLLVGKKILFTSIEDSASIRIRINPD
ncbi:hypothetical protein RclHR1_03220018 [Rhizophagus clarus]|uniref:MACPF domain-containing protein n=1 Tax=Rhizophagus clarus TaxID=94130 RepID=A0A2Z6R8A4_9GLOM|nr:hypothetical protein RclHR1_03220018 [Rhizophagus clarus]